MSHSSTVNLVSQLGEGYDLAVRQWKQETEGRISAMKVRPLIASIVRSL